MFAFQKRSPRTRATFSEKKKPQLQTFLYSGDISSNRLTQQVFRNVKSSLVSQSAKTAQLDGCGELRISGTAISETAPLCLAASFIETLGYQANAPPLDSLYSALLAGAEPGSGLSAEPTQPWGEPG